MTEFSFPCSLDLAGSLCSGAIMSVLQLEGLSPTSVSLVTVVMHNVEGSSAGDPQKADEGCKPAYSR